MAVATEEPTDVALDAVLKALSDPTRRRVMERLGRGQASVSELAEPFEMALPSFVQHLGVLEQAGLVLSQKRGRIRTYRLQPGRLDVLDGWLARQRSLWEQRLDQLDAYLLTMKEDKE